MREGKSFIITKRIDVIQGAVMKENRETIKYHYVPSQEIANDLKEELRLNSYQLG